MLEHGSNGRYDANNRIYNQAMDCVRRFTVSLIVVAIKKKLKSTKETDCKLCANARSLICKWLIFP